MDEYKFAIVGIIGADEKATIDYVKSQLEDANGKPVVIDIDSIGGYVFDGISIHNAILDYEQKVTINITGLAASAASYIAMAADKLNLNAYDNSVMMIHNAFSMIYGDYRDMTKEAQELKSLTNHIANAYVKKTGKDKFSILEMMNNETWMYGDEMKKNGFVDSMIESGKKKKDDEKQNQIEDVKSKFLIMKNSLDSDKYNKGLRKAAAIYNLELHDSDKIGKGVKKVDKETLLNELDTMVSNNGIKFEEITNRLNIQTVTDKHVNALEIVNKLDKLTEGKNPVEFVNGLLDEKKANALAVREAKMTELFGAKIDSVTKKENAVREFAEVYLSGKEINDENVKSLKENSIYLKLAGELMDVNSEMNIIDDKKKNETTVGNKQRVIKL